MADKTGIEWTDATWTPIRARHLITGKVGWHCEHASPGCANCYSESFNERRLGTGLAFKPGHRGDVEHFLDETMLLAPLRWRKPRRIFVCSMTDLFGEWVPDAWIDQVFAVMALSPQHTFQVLTKRLARMRAYLTDRGCENRIGHAVMGVTPVGRDIRSATLSWTPRVGHDFSGRWPLPNVWLGVSTEDQRRADERVTDLLATPAAVRFVSAEPLLGPIDFTRICIGDEACEPMHSSWDGVKRLRLLVNALTGSKSLKWRGLDWIIVGGESGPNARPVHSDWARDIRDQCAAAGVSFHFKQWGAWEPVDLASAMSIRDWMIVDRDGGVDIPDGRAPDENSGEVAMRRVGKARAGRLLDGVEHNGFPEARA